MHQKKIITSGKPVDEAQKALILLHGRGADAADILGLAGHLAVSEYALLAPQATNNTWYPYSFLVPQRDNEPWLSSGIQVLLELVQDINAAGISSERIYFLGFSQGACLTLEFVARNARRWGGVVAFTGGLIGDQISADNYQGDFGSTPIFIGSSDPDPHVPVERVQATVQILTSMHADVLVRIYPRMGHTINQDEIEQANRIVFNK